MIDDDSKLSPKQKQAVAALISQRTVEEAARVAGISVRTLHRWLKKPAFEKAYLDAQRTAFRQSIARLQQMVGPAVSTLGKIMVDPNAPAASRVRASNYILERATEALVLEHLQARVADLEGAPEDSEKDGKK